jgi:poly-gamma-glutamate synthase PgsB/CapB
MWWQNANFSIYLGVLLIILISVLSVEALRHRHHLKRIPIRIHVNGTRGKSSVTRLIAAGLRAGDIRTCAKSTGTLARFIFPDGTEESIYRIGHTNVIEQIQVIRKASKLNAQAIVIECMALQPLLQSLCELRLVRSTHGVLTNARPDHLEVMGPLEKDVALALAGTVTLKGKYFTTEHTHLDIFKKASYDRQSELIAISAENIAEVSDSDMAPFTYTEFKENVALALAVCQSLGVDRQKALLGMWTAMPDPGVLSTYAFHYQQQPMIFANGFAANDPVSTHTLWNQLLIKHADCPFSILLVNCRKDRPERSAQMGDAVLSWKKPDRILLIGTGTHIFEHNYHKNPHQDKPLVTNGENWTAEQILEWVIQQTQQKTLLVGIGNIAGIGLSLIDRCKTLVPSLERG